MFYDQLQAEVERAGKGTGSTLSAHLLPDAGDVKRLTAETLHQAVVHIRTVVRTLVARSLRNGKQWTVEIDKHTVAAVARAKDGDTYLAISTDGIPDYRLIAVILDSVPHVPADDWMPEPDGALGVTPAYGSIVYSTIISTEAQCAVLEEIQDDL